MGKTKQFELWRECNCKCDFCTLGNENEFTSEKLKLEAIKSAYDEIFGLKIGDLDTVGFIGGEFFQGQLGDKNSFVREKFFELMKLCNHQLSQGIINQVWICASLLIGKQFDLWHTLNIFKEDNNLNKVWVLTSWDTEGRFHNPKMVDTWIKNMNTLSWLYPDVRINTTTILTGSFINSYLDETFNLDEFKALYNTSFFFKPPVKPDNLLDKTNEEINKIIPNFFPKRNDFLTFLITFRSREGQDEYNKLYSNDLRADEIVKNYNEEDKRGLVFIRDKEHMSEHIEDIPDDENIQILPCGHPKMFQCYSDSDVCCICDKINLEKV